MGPVFDLFSPSTYHKVQLHIKSFNVFKMVHLYVRPRSAVGTGCPRALMVEILSISPSVDREILAFQIN